MNVFGGYAENGAATGNTLNLTTGTYRGIIAGGVSEAGTATENTVNIFENAIFNGGVLLYGGLSGDGQDSRTGNTLNLRTPITVRGLDNFNRYNFYLPPDFAAGDTMITVTEGGADGAIHLRGAEVTIELQEANSPLKQGDTIVLIDEQEATVSTEIPRVPLHPPNCWITLSICLSSIISCWQAWLQLRQVRLLSYCRKASPAA